ncbi:unnamed protein product [Rotaria sp. Silwood1]|nr:unnamed protein product [Rotaria sp. Silwood1]CAF0929158.1 unnamed protein product [Rotaria sp. Silwood1]CAF3372061.1 unnamed protein product [Rotaria sp. Silwood1]CAF4644289.1 unnamed protein product [Rotaria sp. Silwood1]
MTTILENRTISMILTVPDVKEPLSSVSHSVENLNQYSFALSKNYKPPSIPIYHGSIIRIEQHHDEENTSDLIVRVPNFHHLSLPSINISSIPTNDDQLNETDSQQETRTKRRAPICPILNDSRNHSPSSNQNQTNDVDNSNQNQQSEINSRLINTKRLTIGLRNLSRAITTSCKPKSSSNINEITIIPVLPDVEVITENVQVPASSKKPTKNQNSASKFITPKVFLIKRKRFKMKKKQLSTIPIDTETENTRSTIENSSTNSILKDNETEQQNESKQATTIKLNDEIEQKSKTNDKLSPNSPTLVFDSLGSSSTHCYCAISPFPSDSQTTRTNNISLPIETTTTNILLSNTLIPKEKNDLTADHVQSLVHKDSEQIQDHDDKIEERLYIVHPNGDMYSECYEVTYELDPEYQNRLNNEQEQIHLPKVEDQSSVKVNLDPFQYQDLTLALSNWSPIFSKITSNDSNQIEDDKIDQAFPKSHENINIENLEPIPEESKLTMINTTRIKFQSPENIPQISNDQSPTDQPESVSIFSTLQENDQILSLNDTSIVNEEYTIILKILKHVLQIDQLLQTDTTNELEQQ